MSKELTPMQNLILELEEEIKFINNDDSKEDKYYQNGLKLAYKKAKKHLQQEEQGFKDAFENGLNCNVSGATGQEYYNRKYNK